MARRTTVYDLLSQKGQRKWLQVHVDDALEAAAAVEAGISILSCEPDHHFEEVRAAVPFTFLSVGMPHGAVASPEEAVRLGFAMMERGADAVYCSHSPYFIEAMAREGIPVTGHVGLVPNRSSWTNFRAIGKTPSEAMRVLQNVKDLENAGAAAVEVEVVPVRLAEHITGLTPMITMGMGTGSACDTTYLFSCDVLGNHPGHYPRHSKKYADFMKVLADVQAQRVAAFRAFVDDVAGGGYPQAHHQLEMADDAFEEFLAMASEKFD